MALLCYYMFILNLKGGFMNNVVRIYGTNDMPKLLIEHFLEYISFLPLEINNGTRINSFKEIINFYIIANEEDK